MKRVTGAAHGAILAAAATEFAAHGFAGATVDEIARRSRVNKAMIYYYFGSKQGLYLEILRDIFRDMGARAAAIAAADRAPAAKIEAFIDAFNDLATRRPYMPPMMMREMAEGAPRLDAATLRLMAAVFHNLRRILDEGAAVGAFRPANPMLTYFTLVSPIILFRASALVRAALAKTAAPDMPAIDTGMFVAYLKSAALTVLTAGQATTAVTPRPARRRARPTPAGDHA